MVPMVGIERRMDARLALLPVKLVRAACAVTLVPLLCLATPTHAQVLPRTGVAGQVPAAPILGDNDDIEDQSSGIAGLPGYPGRGLSLRAVMFSRYEDNLSRRVVPDDGLRVRANATGSYGLGAGRFGIYAVGSYGRDEIVGNQRLDGADRVYFGSGVTADLSRCTIDAGASYRRNLVFMTDVIQFGNLEQDTKQYGASANCTIGSAISFSGSATRAEIGILRGISTAIDSNRWTYTAGAAFSRPAFGRVSIDGSISDIDLTGRQVLTPTGLADDGLLQRSVRLGLQRDFGSRISLTLGGSFLDTKPKVGSNIVFVDGLPQVVDRSSFSGAGYDAGLIFRLSTRLSLTAQASRDIRTNNFVGSQFQVVDLLDFGANYKLSNNFNFSAGYTYRDTRFRGSVISALETVLRTQDQFYRYYAHFGGKLGRRMNFGFDVIHNERRSNPSVFNFTSTGVGVTLGFELGKQRS
jgi:hypothetical protein